LLLRDESPNRRVVHASAGVDQPEVIIIVKPREPDLRRRRVPLSVWRAVILDALAEWLIVHPLDAALRPVTTHGYRSRGCSPSLCRSSS
jgi:hypothetical protein